MPLSPPPGRENAAVGRRLAAIVFADVVGYSRLMAANEIGTFGRWSALYRDALKPLAERHGGRVGDLRGDGIVIEFDSPSNAVEWARAAHVAAAASGSEDEAAFALRVAIHVGNVIATGDGLFGDAVNLTARLQEHAARDVHRAGRAEADRGHIAEFQPHSSQHRLNSDPRPLDCIPRP